MPRSREKFPTHLKPACCLLSLKDRVKRTFSRQYIPHFLYRQVVLQLILKFALQPIKGLPRLDNIEPRSQEILACDNHLKFKIFTAYRAAKEMRPVMLLALGTVFHH